MRFFWALAAAWCAAAQTAPFTLGQVLGAPFPSELTAATTGGKIAWVSNARGVRNILVAEPPAYQPRQVTAYTQDDGQEIAALRWTADATALVYVRGGTANPAQDPHGVSEEVWIVPLSGGQSRRIGAGSDPAVSRERVAYVSHGQIWWATLDGKNAPAAAFRARGDCREPAWSPDGTRLSFVSGRGDHSLIGVYDVAGDRLRYLDASTDRDSEPAWSPDGKEIAFVREPSSGQRAVREARREGEPWSIRAARADTGAGREVWRARSGAGSVFRGLGSREQLLWTANGRIVFPWEGDGWTHLYSVAAAGGTATLLTPGAFEVEEAALSADRREVVYSSNQDDIDRRHLWQVSAESGRPRALTPGSGIEVAPAPASEGAIAMLRSDAQHLLHPAVRIGGAVRDLGALPGDFPLSSMVTPQAVMFPAADGLMLHGQLFLPAQRAARAPAVVFFHGGSRRQMLLGWHPMAYYSNAYALNQYLASRGYIVLSVNYRSGTGYGLDFREALHYGPSGASEYNDVQGAGMYLRSRADVDAARIGAWGGSYGGYLVAMALARASDLFHAGVDFHGVHDWAIDLGIPAGAADYRVAFESSPMNFLSTWKSPVLLIQGDDDPDVLFRNTVMLADALRLRHVEMEELVFPDEVHDFLLYRSWREAYQATVDFLDRKLK